MVYIELNGRIGNHLFQIAAGASLAAAHNDNFCLVCHEDYLLAKPDNCFIREYIRQFENTIFSGMEILDNRPSNYLYYSQTEYNYKTIEYFPNIMIHGTFHSELFFVPKTVHELFRIPESIKSYIIEKYGNILSRGVTSIHVRRGDYCKIPHQYPVCSRKYFIEAINIIGKNKNYLFISDDIQWCKDNFKGDNFYFTDNEEVIIDLYIQTLCQNNILSNSTFSWWGAWLNRSDDKIVICPTPWYGKSKEVNLNVSDLIPESWIQIRNPLSIKIKILSEVLLMKENVSNFLPKSLKMLLKKYL